MSDALASRDCGVPNLQPQYLEDVQLEPSRWMAPRIPSTQPGGWFTKLRRVVRIHFSPQGYPWLRALPKTLLLKSLANKGPQVFHATQLVPTPLVCIQHLAQQLLGQRKAHIAGRQGSS